MKLKIDKVEWVCIAGLLLILFLLFSITGKSQVVGVNGAGFFENRTPQSDLWLDEATQGKTNIVRVPGGAIAKLADPLNPEGWGLTHEAVDSIVPLYGSDEEEKQDKALEKWHGKVNQQKGEPSYLDELVAYCKARPNTQVIYAANVFIDVERGVFPVEYLNSKGVKLAAVELGNETYSQFKHDFPAFLKRTEALRSKLRALGVPVVYPAAASGTRERGEGAAWNTALNNHLKVEPGGWVCFHPYYDKREFPALAQPVDTIAAFGQIAAWDFQDQFRKMKNLFTNCGNFIVTEFNSQPSNLIGDTDLNQFLIDRFFEAAKTEFNYICIHSGVAPDAYGIIYGTERTGQRLNTTYYSFADQFEENGGETDTIISNCRDTTEITGYTYTYQPVIEDTIICIKRFLRKRICYKISYIDRYDTIETPVYTTIRICDTTIVIGGDTIPTDTIPNTGGIQPLNADTLVFYNETEFRDFLKHYKIADYEIIAPKYTFDCSVVPDSRLYPAQGRGNDDALNQDKFNGLPNMSIRDHIGTRKMIVVFIPSLNDPDADFCNVTEWYTNPLTGQVAEFHNVYTWWDYRGEQMFNVNLKLWLLWGFDEKVYSFVIDGVHEATGYDYTFTDLFPEHETMELAFQRMREYYGILLIK